MTEGKKKENKETKSIAAETSKQESMEMCDIKALKAKLKKREKEIEELAAKAEEFKAEYLRQLADKENLRKRLEREKNDFLQFALAEYLKELLPVVDNFERALESPETEDKSLREGVDLIYKQLIDLLKKLDVTPIKTEQGKFDPNIHQAFMTEEAADVAEPMISQEFQKGYMLQNRLLRPALVKVIVPKKES